MDPGPGPDDDLPIESRPRRNPPRDWAAPPPWATGLGPGATVSPRSSGAPRPVDPVPDTPPSADAPSFLAPPPRSTEGQGLAGSAADRLANGESIADVMPATGAPSTRSADLPSAAPDPELAGLVAGAAATGAAGAGARSATPMTDEQRAAAGYPPATRSGRRPAVSSTRPAGRSQDKSPQLEHVQHDGPSWEHARRYEAYPTIKTRTGFGGMPGLPRVALLAGALGIAALALFFLPALLGVGGGGGTASPSPSATPRVTASPSPTAVPEPTPQVYVIKEGDTLSKIAKRNDITLDELLAANKETIKDPDKISVGDEIIIPVPVPEDVSGGSEEIDRAVGARGVAAAAAAALSGGDVDGRDPARLHPEGRIDVLGRGARSDDQEVRLVGVPGVADLARDHAQARVAAQEPATDALHATQRLHAVADVHAHLGLLVHQRDRALAIAAVQLLEEVFHRLDSTHARSVASGDHERRRARPDDPDRRLAALRAADPERAAGPAVAHR